MKNEPTIQQISDLAAAFVKAQEAAETARNEHHLIKKHRDSVLEIEDAKVLDAEKKMADTWARARELVTMLRAVALYKASCKTNIAANKELSGLAKVHIFDSIVPLDGPDVDEMVQITVPVDVAERVLVENITIRRRNL